MGAVEGDGESADDLSNRGVGFELAKRVGTCICMSSSAIGVYRPLKTPVTIRLDADVVSRIQCAIR